MSLLQRVQARLNIENNTKDSQEEEEEEKENTIIQEKNDDSESDVDDDISLDQCISLVEQKSQDPNSSFTRIVNIDKITKKTLREVLYLHKGTNG